ncbi:MAG: IS256 family transposase, partial [Mycobacterium sp.]
MLTVVSYSAGRDNTTDPATSTSSLIDEIVREGARLMLAAALRAEV